MTGRQDDGRSARPRAPRDLHPVIPSSRLPVLLSKEIAELFAARSFWLLLLIVGLLAGQSFIDAVNA